MPLARVDDFLIRKYISLHCLPRNYDPCGVIKHLQFPTNGLDLLSFCKKVLADDVRREIDFLTLTQSKRFPVWRSWLQKNIDAGGLNLFCLYANKIINLKL